MKKNKTVEFLKKIHFSIIDDKYLAGEVLNSSTKSVVLFFILLFTFSVFISAISRTVKITMIVPEKIFNAVGVLKFEDYKLVSPDTVKEVENWRLKEIGTLVSGVKIPAAADYPVRITVGEESSTVPETEFVNIGKTHFSTNILPSFFTNGADNMINVSWKEILNAPNVTVNTDYYKTLFSKPFYKINIFFAQIIIIGVFQMFTAILQIWISLMVYLIFFGKKLNVPAKLRLLMLTTIPYFIIMPVSFCAANGISFATDIALVCALIITIRAITQVELFLTKRINYEKL